MAGAVQHAGGKEEVAGDGERLGEKKKVGNILIRSAVGFYK